MKAFCLPTGCEAQSVNRRLADRHGVGGTHPPHQPGVRARGGSVAPRPRRGRHAGQVEEVLDRNGGPGQQLDGRRSNSAAWPRAPCSSRAQKAPSSALLRGASECRLDHRHG